MPTLYQNFTTPRIGQSDPATVAAQQKIDEGLLRPKVAPAPTPVPTSTTGTPTLTTRYANNLNTPATPAVAEPNIENFRAQQRGLAQATINAINSRYAGYIAEDKKAKKNLESRAYISSLAGGLSGAPSGAAKSYKAAETGEKVVRRDIEQRDALINAANAEAELRASSEFQKERERYLSTVKDRALEEQKIAGNLKATAEGEIGNYAKKYSYDEWAKTVGPDRVKQYMQETNRDEAGLRSLFFAGIKKDELVSTTGTKMSDGSVAYFKKNFDDAGNITGVTEVARIQGSGGKAIKSTHFTDNGIQILYTDGTYEERNANGTVKPGGTTVTGKKVTGAPAGVTSDVLEQARARLASIGSYAGYANPYLYIDSYNDWVAKGGSPESFKKNFPPENYINPEHNFLKDEATGQNLIPTYLQNSKKVLKPATTATTDTSSGGRTY